MSSTVDFASSIPGVIGDVMLSKIKYTENRLRPKSDVGELVNSIRENGLLQPIVVRPKNGYFEIVAGNRRRMACETLRWRKMPCHIVELDDKKAFEYSLVENIQRQTLSAVEEAQAFKIYVADFGYGGISELARKIGKSPSYITKRIHLLDLPPTVIESITNRSLDPSLAEELHSIKDQSRQSELASLIVKRHLSLRKARGVLSQYKTGVEPENSDDDSWVSALAHRQKALDKLIVTLRIAMNNIGPVVSDNEDDWLIWEILMHHKNLVHGQIDLLIKEKRKLNHRLVAGMS